jgi:hypothetical protein
MDSSRENTTTLYWTLYGTSVSGTRMQSFVSTQTTRLHFFAKQLSNLEPLFANSLTEHALLTIQRNCQKKRHHEDVELLQKYKRLEEAHLRNVRGLQIKVPSTSHSMQIHQSSMLTVTTPTLSAGLDQRTSHQHSAYVCS